MIALVFGLLLLLVGALVAVAVLKMRLDETSAEVAELRVSLEAEQALPRGPRAKQALHNPGCSPGLNRLATSSDLAM